MVNTNSKAVRQKIQAHIRVMQKGQGGLTALFEDIEHLMSSRKVSSYNAAYEYCMGGGFAIYNEDIRLVLRSWGLTDSNRIRDPSDLYFHLVSKECARMYDQWKRTGRIPAAKTAKRTIRRATKRAIKG